MATPQPRTKDCRRRLGDAGERLACDVLVAEGMLVLDRNWRCASGELDIVARDGDTIVFCEVKTRRGDLFGTPAAAVTPTKLRRLRRLGAAWLRARGERPARVRFDVVAVRWPAAGAPVVEHLAGVA